MPAWATAAPANWLGARNAVGPELAQAENDVIWSSPDAWPGAACTYFHIEVQSTVQQNLALRMLRYMALHSFRLWSDHGPPMPLVVPIVFYTADRRYSERKDQSWAGKQS